MNQEPNTEAAETVQTTDSPAVDLPRLVLHPSTPETDAIYVSGYSCYEGHVPINFARRLEQYRDAALIALREMSRRNYKDAGDRDIRWNNLRDERDQARRELAQAKAEIQGLKNKFDCALTMAAVAENRLHHLTKPIHNGVGEADMYSQEEYEKLMQQ